MHIDIALLHSVYNNNNEQNTSRRAKFDKKSLTNLIILCFTSHTNVNLATSANHCNISNLDH